MLIPSFRSTLVHSSSLDTQYLRLITEGAAEMITIQQEDGVIAYSSSGCVSLLGYPVSEMVGRSAYDLFHPDDVPRIAAHHMASLHSSNAPSISYRIRCRDASYKFVETVSTTRRCGQGEKKTVCITREVVDRDQQLEKLERDNARLQQLVSSDELTGVANRRKFNDRLGQLVLESSRGRSVALIVCDLDDFKVLNDTHGHQAGDVTLVAVAQILRTACREMDTVCRVGGEEFAVILPGCDLMGAKGLAERMRCAICEMTALFGPIRMSFGVTEALKKGDSLENIYLRADTALYRAKSNGKNCVEVYEAERFESGTDME